MTDSIRFHLLSTSILAALLYLPVMAELLIPGVQVFRMADGTPNEQLYATAVALAQIAAITALIFAYAGLVSAGIGRGFGWILVAIAIVGLCYLVASNNAPFEWSVYGAQDDVLGLPVWQWLGAFGVAATLLSLLRASRFRTRMPIVIPLLIALLAGVGLHFGMDSNRPAHFQTMSQEGAMSAIVAAPVLLALLLSTLPGEAQARWLFAIAGLVVIGACMLTGMMLGAADMQKYTMDHSEVLAPTVLMHATARIALCLLVIGTAMWADRTHHF